MGVNGDGHLGLLDDRGQRSRGGSSSSLLFFRLVVILLVIALVPIFIVTPIFFIVLFSLVGTPVIIFIHRIIVISKGRALDEPQNSVWEVIRRVEESRVPTNQVGGLVRGPPLVVQAQQLGFSFRWLQEAQLALHDHHGGQMVHQEVVRNLQTSLAKQHDHSYGLGSTLPEDGSGSSSFSAGTFGDERSQSGAQSS